MISTTADSRDRYCDNYIYGSFDMGLDQHMPMYYCSWCAKFDKS